MNPKESTIRLSAQLLYATGWLVYITYSMLMFPVLHITACIPVILLFGLGAWLFGRSIGLAVIIPGMMYNALLTGVIYPEHLDVFEYKLAGMITVILLVILIGTLKGNYSAIRSVNRELDRKVEMRNRDLHNLTAELLDNAEKQRVSRGQELHDGLGQQLTGVQLLCASLLDQLRTEAHPAAEQADTIVARASAIHNHIRRLARMLFPIRISQVGLHAALTELAACIKEIRPVQFTIENRADHIALSEPLCLQLYRICQETALHSIESTDAGRIHLQLNAHSNTYELILRHDGCRRHNDQEHSILKLIRYRLQQISGTLKETHSPDDGCTYLFRIPLLQKGQAV